MEPAKQTPRFYDVLWQLVAINITMLGGCLFFLSPDNCHPALRFLAMAMFCIALGFVTVGICDAIRRINWWKTLTPWGAGVFLILGIMVALAGITTPDRLRKVAQKEQPRIRSATSPARLTACVKMRHLGVERWTTIHRQNQTKDQP